MAVSLYPGSLDLTLKKGWTLLFADPRCQPLGWGSSISSMDKMRMWGQKAKVGWGVVGKCSFPTSHILEAQGAHPWEKPQGPGIWVIIMASYAQTAYNIVTRVHVNTRKLPHLPSSLVL